MSDAARFADLFRQVYLRFHVRRDARAVRLTPQMWAVLQHLALAGPLTISECAKHFDRAQSVVSETVDALVAKGLLERVRDQRDRRRTLVWLTDEAHATMKRDERVLDDARLERALARLSAPARRGLLEGMGALVRGATATTRNEEDES